MTQNHQRSQWNQQQHTSQPQKSHRPPPGNQEDQRREFLWRERVRLELQVQALLARGESLAQVPALVVQLENTYDVKEIALRAAIEHRGSFRLVHHDTLQKIDVALSAYRAYSRVKQERAQRHALEQGSRAFSVASPEDTILTLLERYNGGGQRFQRLWEAIVEILVMRGSTLDLAYLRLWATSLDVALLLEQALATTGVSDA